MTEFLCRNAVALAIPAIWIAWAGYWWWSARGNKENRRHESVSSRLAHLLPLAVATLLLVPEHLPLGVLSQPLFPGSSMRYWTGVAMVIAGLAFTVWARLHLGRNWSATVTVKRDHELVTDGPYRLVRHPIYTGLILAFIGSALARNEWRGVLAVVIVFVALWRKLKLEERWMTETFGVAYTRYRERVHALIPGLL